LDDRISRILTAYDNDGGRPTKLAVGENAIYEYRRDGAAHLLRVTPAHRRSREQVLAEVRFIRYLNENGGPAVTLDFPRDGGLVITEGRGDDAVNVYSYRKAPGGFPGDEAWGRDLFLKMGREVGKLHSLSSRYVPEGEPRMQWFEDEDLARVCGCPSHEGKIAQRCRDLIERLKAVEANAGNYGLIHGDIHAGNMAIEEGRLVLFDFDDCQYDFFLKDVANALFFAHWYPDMTGGATRQHHEDTGFAEAFLDAFLEGYRESYDVDAAVYEHLQEMLMLQRCLLWGILHEEKDDLGSWEGVHARWTAEILDEVPFVDLDFRR
jgi:Ser/Thr protein kinase RdoA (MazF antagonist)